MDTPTQIEYVGGPLDGQTVDIGPGEDITGGGYIVVPGRHLRAHYAPLPGEVAHRWRYQGDVLV